MAETIVSCETCGLVQKVEGLVPGTAAECIRCASFITAPSSTGPGPSSRHWRRPEPVHAAHV
jgi:uncharacterized paraquat-inducible protein A